MAAKIVGKTNCLAVLVFVICGCLLLCNVAAQVQQQQQQEGKTLRDILQKNPTAVGGVKYGLLRKNEDLNSDPTLVKLANRDPALIRRLTNPYFYPNLAQELRDDPSKFDRTTEEFDEPNTKICTRKSNNMQGECDDDNACKKACQGENNSNISGSCKTLTKKRQVTGTILEQSKKCGCNYIC